MSFAEGHGPAARVGSFVAAPIRPQTYLNLVYLLLAFPLGLLYFVFLTVGVTVGLSLTIILVGVPLLVITFAAALGLAALERWLTTLLLDVDIESSTALEGETRLEQGVDLLTDIGTWKAVVYLPTKFVLGVASLFVIATALTTGVSMLFVPLHYGEPGLYVGLVTNRPIELHPSLYLGWNRLLVGFETVFTVDAWRITTLSQALVVAAAGAIVCLLSLGALNWLARFSGWYADVMLGDAYDAIGAARRRVAEGP